MPATSSKRQVVRLSDEAPHGGISPAVRWGDLLFVSGLAAFDPATRSVIGDDVETQARTTLDKLTAILQRAGTDLAHVIRLDAFLRDAEDFAAWSRVFAEYFPDEPPARSTVIAGQPLNALLVEVTAIVGIPD